MAGDALLIEERLYLGIVIHLFMTDKPGSYYKRCEEDGAYKQQLFIEFNLHGNESVLKSC